MSKIWLPTPLYRLKPLLLGFAGALLLYFSKDWFTTGLAFLCLGYAGWIIIIRLLWSTANVVKTKVGSVQAGGKKTHVVNLPDKRSNYR
jgi:hypothetical protein